MFSVKSYITFMNEKDKRFFGLVRWAEKRCRICGTDKGRYGLLMCWDCWNKYKKDIFVKEDNFVYSLLMRNEK